MKFYRAIDDDLPLPVRLSSLHSAQPSGSHIGCAHTLSRGTVPRVYALRVLIIVAGVSRRTEWNMRVSAQQSHRSRSNDEMAIHTWYQPTNSSISVA